MAARDTPDIRPAPRLYLAATVTGDAAALGRTLAEMAKDADVAAVLLRDATTNTKAIKTLIAAVQAAGAALLIDGDAGLAQTLGADGVHVTGTASLKGALDLLKPNGIVGVGGLKSRHNAMTAGESLADYMLFGEPDSNAVRPSTEAIVERVAWWAELFEPPCVAYAATTEEARNFATAGADFVLVDNLVWDDQRGARAALMDVNAAIRQDAPQTPSS
jgi:thiamine-phosphate pyrophosphorylase